jgi:beta-xylosidase
VRWQDGWPVIGDDPTGAGPGQPVANGEISNLGEDSTQRPQTSDDFSLQTLGPQWEWNHNPDDLHWSLSKRPGYLRLLPMRADGLLTARNTLTQCMQDNSFQFTARVDVSALKKGAHAGLAMFDNAPSGLEIVDDGAERRLDYFHGDTRTAGPLIGPAVLQLRVRVDGDQARYSFSADDGGSFHDLGSDNKIRFSWWKGSRPALFAYTTETTDPGSVDFDWAHYEPIGQNPW